MNVEEIPLPPGAEKKTIDGSYEVALDNATNAILIDFKKNYPKTSEKITFLPTDAESARVFAFYEPVFTEKGFSKDAGVPPVGRNYQINVWRKDGWLGGQAVAVAVIEAGRDAAGKPIKFLAVYTGEK